MQSIANVIVSDHFVSVALILGFSLGTGHERRADVGVPVSLFTLSCIYGLFVGVVWPQCNPFTRPTAGDLPKAEIVLHVISAHLQALYRSSPLWRVPYHVLDMLQGLLHLKACHLSHLRV
jgi:hypothetical protein